MLSWSHKHHYPMCHAVAAAAPAVHCNGIQPYKGAAWEEGRLLLLSSGGVINYLALWWAIISFDVEWPNNNDAMNW